MEIEEAKRRIMKYIEQFRPDDFWAMSYWSTCTLDIPAYNDYTFADALTELLKEGRVEVITTTEGKENKIDVADVPRLWKCNFAIRRVYGILRTPTATTEEAIPRTQIETTEEPAKLLPIIQNFRQRMAEEFKKRKMAGRCEICGQNVWKMGDKPAAVVIDDLSTTWRVPSARIPCATLICKNCGNLRLHVLAVLGFFPEGKKEEGRSE